MFRGETRALLLLGCAAIGASEPVLTQDMAASKSRDLRIPGTAGQPSFFVRIWAEGQTGIVNVWDEKGRDVQKLVCPFLRDDPIQRSRSALQIARQPARMRRQGFGDGHADLAGIREFGAKWARYCVWLYDSAKRSFTYICCITKRFDTVGWSCIGSPEPTEHAITGGHRIRGVQPVDRL